MLTSWLVCGRGGSRKGVSRTAPTPLADCAWMGVFRGIGVRLCRNLDMNFRECPECELRLYGVLGSTRTFAGLATMGATAPVRSVGEEKQLCHSLIQTEYASSTMTRARVSLLFCVCRVGATPTQSSRP